MTEICVTRPAKPFLKWAGGKNWLIKHLPWLLGDLEYAQYHEPFLGGASVFFHLVPPASTLSDTNDELINTYIQVRDNVDVVIEHIKSWKISEEKYYEIRSMKSDDLVIRAARFIFLNRTSFNGIYRVNRKGEYNVPYGKRDSYEFDYERIQNASSALNGTSLKCCSFEDTLDDIKANDLVFLDPPYTVSHNNNGFIEYNKKLFSLEDQYSLRDYILKVMEKEAYFLLTNAAHETIADIFSDCGTRISMNRFSSLGGAKAKRGNVGEYIFTNIPVREKDGII